MNALPTPTPKETNASIFEMFTLPLKEEVLETINNKLLASSFYLPADILGNPDYKISPIFVLESGDFARVYEVLRGTWHIHADCDYYLLAFAKSVGVSLRVNKKTGKRYVTLKLWYGKNPYQKLDTGFDAQYAKRLQAMHRWIETDWK